MLLIVYLGIIIMNKMYVYMCIINNIRRYKFNDIVKKWIIYKAREFSDKYKKIIHCRDCKV